MGENVARLTFTRATADIFRCYLNTIVANSWVILRTWKWNVSGPQVDFFRIWDERGSEKVTQIFDCEFR